MPKPKKDDKYKVEQEQIIDKILDILDVYNNNNSFILHEVENNDYKISKINELVDDIKKYFPCKNMGGVKEPEKFKRAWLSVIRQVLKRKFNLITGDYTIKGGGIRIRTRIYYLVDK